MTKQIETVEVMGSDGKTYQRTPCEIWGRVMGYLRPVSGFNVGKKSERFSRRYFDENKVNNSEFLKRYAVTQNA